jgi:Secretion system C-terminal sorting domain
MKKSIHYTEVLQDLHTSTNPCRVASAHRVRHGLSPWGVLAMLLLILGSPRLGSGQCLMPGTNVIRPSFFNIAIFPSQGYVDLFPDEAAMRANTTTRVQAGLTALNGVFATKKVKFNLVFFPIGSFTINQGNLGHSEYNQKVLDQFITKWPCLGVEGIIVPVVGSGHGFGTNNIAKITDGALNNPNSVAHEIGHLLGLLHLEADCGTHCNNAASSTFMCPGAGAMDFTSCDNINLANKVFTQSHCAQWAGFMETLPHDFICPTKPSIRITTDQPYVHKNCQPDRSLGVFTITIKGGEANSTGLTVRARFNKTIFDVDLLIPGQDFNTIDDTHPDFTVLKIFENGVEKTFDLANMQEETFHFQLTYNPDIVNNSNTFGFEVDGLLNGSSIVVASEANVPVRPFLSVSGSPQIFINGYPLLVTDNLIINTPGNDFVIQNPIILVKPGKSITIAANNTLKFPYNIQTEIAGCDGMWAGINLNNGAKIVATNISIADAQKAISVPKSGSVLLNNVQFLNNNYGIVTKSGGTGNYNISLNNCRFSFEASQFKSFYTNQSPTPLEKSFVGLWVSDAPVGISLIGVNRFNNLKYGIISYNSNIQVENTNYQNITQVPVGFGYNAPYPTGKAIYASGGTFIANNNTFNMVHTGIETSNTSLTAESNNMASMVKGIRTYGNNPIKLNANTIGASLEGIYFTSYSPLPKIISDNIITIAGDVNGFGIKGAGSSSFGQGTAKVFGNQVTMNNGTVGIDLISLGGLTADNNYVNLTNENNKIGIQIQGGEGNEIKCNNTTSANGDKNFIGIKGTHCSKTSFTCNNTLNTYVGLQFEGMLAGKLKPTIAGNTMKNNGVGLRLGADATVSTQEHQGNKWEGSFSEIGAENGGDPSSSQFIVDAAENPLYLPSSFNPTNWFDNVNTPATSFQCLISTCPINQVNSPTSEGFIKSTSKGELAGTDYKKINNWIAQRRLLSSIQTEGNPYPNDIDVNTFINNTTTNGLGANIAVQTGIRQAFNISAADQLLLQYYENSIKDLLNNLSKVEAKLSTKGISLSDSLTWVNERNTLRSNLLTQNTNKTTKIDNLTISRLTSVNGLITQNNGLVAFEQWEQNEKKVLGIFFSTIGVGNWSLNASQQSELSAIAALCPLSDGEAVFSARALLSLFEETPVFWNDAVYCQKKSGGRSQEEINIESKQHLRLYPNPVNESLTIDYDDFPDFAEQKLLITNLYGQVVKDVALKGKRGNAIINVSGLSEGVYYYYVPASGKSLFSGKLIIVH